MGNNVITEEDIRRTKEIDIIEMKDGLELLKKYLKKETRDKDLIKKIVSDKMEVIREYEKESIPQMPPHTPKLKPARETKKWGDEIYPIHQHTDGILRFSIEPVKEQFDYYEPIVINFKFRNISDKNITINKRLGSYEIFHPHIEDIIKYAPGPLFTKGHYKPVFGFLHGFVRTDDLRLEDFVELKHNGLYENKFQLKEFSNPSGSELNLSPGQYEISLEYSVFRGFNDGHRFNLKAWSGVLETSCKIDLNANGMEENNYRPRYCYPQRKYLIFGKKEFYCWMVPLQTYVDTAKAGMGC